MTEVSNGLAKLVNFREEASASMADYYSILARAITGLDPNSPAARRRLYDRARSALLSEMQNAYPPIPRFEIINAQIALDTAIGQVEADAGLVTLEKFVEHVERDGGPNVEHVEECGRSYDGVQPNLIASASPIPSSVSVPRLPANQNIDRRGSFSGIRRLFRWRPTCSIEISEAENKGGDTWLAELLERASREEDDDYRDFAPKRASNRNVYSG
jgi:hypothetical protein